MTSESELYRKQVAMAVGVALGITLEEAVTKLSGYERLINAWSESGVDFTATATILITELKS